MAPNIVETGVLPFLEDPLPVAIRVPNLFGLRTFVGNVVVIRTSAPCQLVLGPADTLVLLSCGLAIVSLLAFA